jgi:hypothetical protein
MFYVPLFDPFAIHSRHFANSYRFFFLEKPGQLEWELIGIFFRERSPWGLKQTR